VLGWDRRLESWIAGHRVGALDPVMRGITYSGVWGALWLALAVIAAVALRRWQVLLWVVVADLAAQLSTTVLQTLVGRSRPNVPTLVPEPHSHSFPSGHASSSFACAVVLASFAPRLRVWLYLLAAVIALSRLYVGVHYPLDVVAGAVWGVVVGLAVLRVRRAIERRRSSSGSRETPSGPSAPSGAPGRPS
jgi:undecaprenyl-diphosphatase